MQYSEAYGRRDLERMEQLYTEPNLSRSNSSGRSLTADRQEHPGVIGKALDQVGDATHTVGENPLLLGVAVFAVGIAVGLALPSTQGERQLLGDMRNQVANKAQALASNVVQEVKQMADEVTPKLEETASKAVEEFAEIGKEAADQVKQKVRDAATAVQQKAEELQTGEKTATSVSAYS
jgi:ElaB/YqjD/DUF883 family membrane-anchored ribosome-binding protein